MQNHNYIKSIHFHSELIPIRILVLGARQTGDGTVAQLGSGKAENSQSLPPKSAAGEKIFKNYFTDKRMMLKHLSKIQKGSGG